MEPVDTIPGIGATLSKDFARIGVRSLGMLKGRDPQKLFDRLVAANAAERHGTSKNYLYVIRMAVYYANGGRDPSMLKWNAWRDPPGGKADGTSPNLAQSTDRALRRPVRRKRS